ncbi:hypothetical protein X961_4109 [Burkholderia pseudomallei MSHR5613]|nr:hypothetical protein X961_4109 [Burkholderia pseudomallei MSHR5613]
MRVTRTPYVKRPSGGGKCMATVNYLKERTNLRTILVAVLLLLLGFSLLIASETVPSVTERTWLKAITSNLGGLVIASISIATLWELFSKRALFDELLGKATFAEEIRVLGLVGLSVNPLKGADFSKLIRDANKLDIFVCYANTWRNSYEQDLRVLARKPNARVRLIVPDPTNQRIIEELAHRFNAANSQEIVDKIDTAQREFRGIFTAIGSNADFSIWTHHETPVTSFYRFDNVAVVTLYKHARGRGETPTIIAERPGALYSYIENEVDAMVKGAGGQAPLATRVFPAMP